MPLLHKNVTFHQKEKQNKITYFRKNVGRKVANADDKGEHK